MHESLRPHSWPNFLELNFYYVPNFSVVRIWFLVVGNSSQSVAVWVRHRLRVALSRYQHLKMGYFRCVGERPRLLEILKKW